jgi:hypothetical protein
MGEIAREIYGAYEVHIDKRVVGVEPYAIIAAAPGCFVSSFIEGTQLAKLPDKTTAERRERDVAFLASCAINLTALLMQGRSDNDRHIGNEHFNGSTLQMLDLWGVLTPEASHEMKIALTAGLARSIAQSSWIGSSGGQHLTQYLMDLSQQKPDAVEEIGWHQEAVLAIGDKLSALGWRERLWVFSAALDALGEDYWRVAKTELSATWKGRLVIEFLRRFDNPVRVCKKVQL